MATSTTSIRLPKEVLRALDTLAAATARNRNYLITEAVKAFVVRETWHLRRIQDGLRQIEAGQVVPDSEMEAFWASWTRPEAMAEARAAVEAELAAPASSSASTTSG